MHVQAYLFFDGVCEEAVEFYKRAVGASVELLVRMKDAPPSPGMPPPGAENKILHATLKIGDSLVLASDGRCGGNPDFRGFALSLAVAGPAEAERAFNALVDGGTVEMPLAKTFFSPMFGMLVDRFGVHWMVDVAP